MPTAARGATLILLGALLAQAPLTAAAYEPRDPTTAGPPDAVVPGGPSPITTSASPSATDSASTTPTMPTTPDPSVSPTGSPSAPVVEPPAARSWSELAQQVTQTSPGDLALRAADTSAQAQSMMRCFKLDAENYCLGLGFVDHVPTGAELQETLNPPSLRADGDAGVEQDIATGDLSPADLVAARAAMPKSVRVNAELDEMQAAWNGRDKARDLRLLAEAQPTNSTPASSDAGRESSTVTPAPTAAAPTVAPTTTPTVAPTATPTVVPTVVPTRSAPTAGTPTPVPTAPKPAPTTVAAPVKVPASAYIMTGYQVSQEKGYWCGPATFQSIDWADDKQKDTQASWAKDLGATTSGTAISAMVKQTNVKTTWPKAAGTYIVQNVKGWNAQTFLTVHEKHIGVYKAPVIEHVQLLKRYFPYLAFNHSGHYQVGRGYDKAKGTIGIFEVFDERRFNSRGNVTNGPKNIPASALLNATLANSFKNIGL